MQVGRSKLYTRKFQQFQGKKCYNLALSDWVDLKIIHCLELKIFFPLGAFKFIIIIIIIFSGDIQFNQRYKYKIATAFKKIPYWLYAKCQM